jgi:3-deoxy-7-phosphoheptulonate synthase
MSNMNFICKLPIPKDTKEIYPITPEAIAKKAERDEEIKRIFTGKSDKLVLVIGPCSADAEEPVMEYVTRLARIQEQVKDRLLLIPRIYTNKPRTTGDGYKGMLHQPDPTGKPDLYHGILAIRHLHARALTETGLSTADEMLYPANHRYLSDLLSYVAVGARSVENQQHRLTASGLAIPVGMKNPTEGHLSIMMNAITAAQHKHTFIYRGWEVQSQGNPYAHAILRGYMDNSGRNLPNYHYEDLAKLHEIYAKSGLENPAVIVDTNHANSGKKYLEQIRIAKDVLYSSKQNPDIRKMVKGLMIESYIEDGAQKIGEDQVYGKSITDPCLGWEKTEKLIFDIADSL